MAKKNIPSGETGATFITILVALIILAVFLLLAVQPYATVMQREKEAELIFRGEQICEALRNYQKDHGGGFPAEMKELLKQGQNKVPYLRRLFKNPFDAEGKWCYLAPGTTAVVIKEDGSKEILPAGGQAETEANQGQGGLGSGNKQRKAMILPFKLDGKEGLPILGVYAKFDKPAFRKYLDSTEISEWYFSPLTIQPKPPINLNPQPPPPKNPDQPGQPGQPGNDKDED
jgi:type II secretory pathway pseudopilin PulG